MAANLPVPPEPAGVNPGGVHPRFSLTTEQKAELRSRLLAFMAGYDEPKIVVTRGRDGRPRTRLMSVRNDDRFTLYALSVKPSPKLDELAADAWISVLWYRNNADDNESDQPLRLLEIEGSATLLNTAAEIRAMPGKTFIGDMPDAELEARHVGIRIIPHRIRAEGFYPGPRYPIYLKP